MNANVAGAATRPTFLAPVPVWQAVDSMLEQELVAFWRTQGAIADEQAASTRAGQAVCIARDAEGSICAVGTAVVRVLPRLRQPMYYYRQFFAATHRGLKQTVPFFLASKRILQDYNASLASPESLGMLLELENSMLSSHYKLAHVAGAEATFIGYSPRGLQLRVSYFEGALLLAPSPMRRGMRRAN